MRRFLTCGLAVAATFLVTLPSAAGQYGKKDLLGSWTGDVKAMLEATGMMDQMPPDFDISTLLEGFEIRVTFNRDGTVELYNRNADGEKTETERYEVTDSKDNVLTVKSVDDEGIAEIVTITFSDKDHLTMATDAADAPAMQFTRGVKAAKKEGTKEGTEKAK
jgi:hypothetical protein